MKRLTGLSVLLLAAGCGNWSNDDLVFMNAFPSKAELSSKLPEGTARSGLFGERADALAVGEQSAAYENTRNTSRSFNAMLDALLLPIDAVRSRPPTQREGDRRIWGPIADRNQPGFEVRVTMDRSSEDVFSYRVEFRRQGTGEWAAVLLGDFKADAGVRKGFGSVQLRVKRARDLGLAMRDLDAVDTLEIGYSTASDPIRADLIIHAVPGTPGVSQIGLSYQERSDKAGALTFDLFGLSPQIERLQLKSRWLPSGEGRSDSTVLEGTYAGATKLECWDAQFAVVHARESWPGGVNDGLQSACAVIDL